MFSRDVTFSRRDISSHHLVGNTTWDRYIDVYTEVRLQWLENVQVMSHESNWLQKTQAAGIVFFTGMQYLKLFLTML